MSSPGSEASTHGRNALRVAAAVLSVIALVATAGSAFAWNRITTLSSNITTIDVDEELGTDRPTEAPVAEGEGTPTEPMNILVMGTDTRTGQGGGFGDPGQTASGLGHSDTTILLHVAGDRSRALAVSIPRDSWVTRPSCKKGDTSTVSGRFNEAFSAGGPACTIKAVEKLTGVRVDHFVVVDFKGFQAVVDSVGGVPICLKEAVDDEKSGLKLSAGNHVLDGDQALAFARARKTLGDGSDIQRIDRQQIFLSALIRQVQSKGTLTDLPTLYSVLDAVTKSLTTDKKLGSVDALKDLALSMQGLTPSKITFMTVPWVGRSDGATIEWTSKADDIWQSMIDDTQYPPKSTKPAGQKALTTPPSSIRVKVLNGTGTAGKASEVAAELKKLGFVVVSVGNAPSTTLQTTTVAYDPRYDESARTLAYAAQAASKATGKGSTLVLTIGADWKGTQAVSVAKPSSVPSSTKSADENVCVG